MANNPFILKETSGSSGAKPPPLPHQRASHSRPSPIQRASTSAPHARRAPPPLKRAAQRKGVSLLTPEELERYKNLYALTRSRVEGHLSGRHKSPYQGSSSDFADYHEYSPGQDISRIDWRVYGRSKKLYIRRFEEETDMTVYVLVDVSASMRYTGGRRLPKFIQAARLAASIAYLAARQRDKVALGLIANTLLEYRKAGNSRLHVQSVLKCLEGIRPAERTSLGHALRDCSEVFRKRGRLILISDFHDDLDTTLDALGQFVHRGFDIQLMHLLDPDERNLPPSAALEFIDMESAERVKADVEDVRQLYNQRMTELIKQLGVESMRRQIGYHLLDTCDPLHTGLEAYLSIGNNRTRSTV
jgi:uncharacterized protein (DUF58 family)